MLRVKVIKGKKLDVGDIEGLKIYTVADLEEKLTRTNLRPFGIDGYTEVYEIEGHTIVDIQEYGNEDRGESLAKKLSTEEGIHYVVAYHKGQSKMSILERANVKKCKKCIRKVKRKQAIKSWFDTYKTAIITISSVMGAIIAAMIAAIITKKC